MIFHMVMFTVYFMVQKDILYLDTRIWDTIVV